MCIHIYIYVYMLYVYIYIYHRACYGLWLRVLHSRFWERFEGSRLYFGGPHDDCMQGGKP